MHAPLPFSQDHPATAISSFGFTADLIGILAIHVLYREVELAPKPGLVTASSSGSHTDMTFDTFLRSLQALRPYFSAVTACGMQRPDFAQLQSLGIRAESEMLKATGGTNTHRGAIFNLGLLCAASGVLLANRIQLSAAALCQAVARTWGHDILSCTPPFQSLSHGQCMARLHGAGGARQEAAAGFPSAHKIGLSTYRSALTNGADTEQASVQTLFALISVVEDTNLLWRGGPSGLTYAQRAARDFLEAGGIFTADWRARAATIDRDFTVRRLSPGGSADLLGVTLFLAAVDGLI